MFLLPLLKPFPAADEDFNGTSIHGTFESGSFAGNRLYFHIPIFDDHIVEDCEYFNVSLVGPDLEIHIDTAVVKIFDDDCKFKSMDFISAWACYLMA